MDMVNIFTTIIKFYNKWNIQVLVLLSLCLQIILLLFTPFRKRSRNSIIIGPIWLAYVVADWVASFGIGLISDHQGSSPKPDDDRADILAFWATFLLLHLGGPDNASAFSLEDNTFWQRHFIGLIGQVLSTVIVLSQPFPKKKLWIPTILIFVAGTIKYGERTFALYSANLSKYREYLIELVPRPRYTEEKKAEEPKKTEEEEPTELSEVEVVEKAYEFLDICKGLIVDIRPEASKLTNSWSFLHENNSTDAFRVLEVELNLIYELFYTKVFVVYSKRGCIFRYIYWCAVIAALLIFSSIDKHGFRNLDVQISYILLFGTFGLDTVAFFTVAISDWAVVYIRKSSTKCGWRGALCKCFLSLLKYFLTLRRIKRFSEISEDSKFGCFDWVRKFLFGFFYWVRGILFSRWSGSLHTYNFIDYCLKERHRKVEDKHKKSLSSIDFLKDFCDGIKHVSKKPVDTKLWHLIFSQLLRKAKRRPQDEVGMKLRCYDDDYYRIILMWHIATNLCYEKNKLDSVYCKSSIILSDYMLYLLVMQPTFMSAISGMTKIRLRDTYGFAKAFFHKHFPKMYKRATACDKLFNNYWNEEDGKSESRKSHRDAKLEDVESHSVLPEAIALAKYLDERYVPHERWKKIREVWVDLLSYAASHCSAEMHIKQLSKGGEFITFIWLLMAHLGLRDNFESYKDIVKIANTANEHYGAAQTRRRQAEV